MKIVKARQKDVPAICEIWKEFMDFHKKYDKHFSRRKNGHVKFGEFISGKISNRKSLVLAAKIETEIAGYTIASIDNYPPVFIEKYCGAIYDLMVKNEYRRKGIGKKLFVETKKWFENKGIKRIELSVLTKNPISTKFWKKMGFETYMEKRFVKLGGWILLLSPLLYPFITKMTQVE